MLKVFLKLRFLFLLIFILLPNLSKASPPANLVADSIIYNEATEDIEATGNVVIIQGDLELRTNKVIYVASTDSITIPEKLRMFNIITKEEWYADYGSLSANLKNGLLTSARIIQQRHLQISAPTINQSDDGRYTVLDKAVSSYCRICKESSTPFWEIRARKVIADQEKERIYFEDAVFRIMGVPLFYTPYLHMPNQNVKRATGFLKPTYIYTTDSAGGSGLSKATSIKVQTPYFITLGEHADLLLTPWITWDKNTGKTNVNTFTTKFRQELKFAHVDIQHASSKKESESHRWYFLMNATTSKLPYGFSGGVTLKRVSDRTYLAEYGVSSQDRLRSSAYINKTRKDQHIELNLVNYETLRTTESKGTLPTNLIDAELNKRVDTPLIGGILDLKLDTRSHYRTSDYDPDNSGAARDVNRLSSSVTWQKDWVMNNGVLFGLGSELRADTYLIYQDPDLSNANDLTPYFSADMKWPLVKHGTQISQLIQPTIQFVSAKSKTHKIPNDDSLLPEFDETNVLEFSRFPGNDNFEKGKRINLALNYGLSKSDSLFLGLSLGKILRDKNHNQFSQSSGLNGKSTDWLAASHLKLGKSFSLINRALVKDDLSILRNTVHVDWKKNATSTSSKYVWMDADSSEGRPKETSFININASYNILDDWNLGTALNYDFIENKTTMTSGLKIVYKTACTKATFSFDLRPISETKKIEEWKFHVEFGGFGSSSMSNLDTTKICSG